MRDAQKLLGLEITDLGTFLRFFSDPDIQFFFLIV